MLSLLGLVSFFVLGVGLARLAGSPLRAVLASLGAGFLGIVLVDTGHVMLGALLLLCALLLGLFGWVGLMFGHSWAR